MRIEAELKPYLVSADTDTRFMINDPWVVPEKNEMYATDGHMMGIYKVEMEEGDDMSVGSVPRAALIAAAKGQKTGKKNTGYLRIQMTQDGRATVTADDGSVTAFNRNKPEEGGFSYPDVESVRISDKLRKNEFEVYLDMKLLTRIAESMGAIGKQHGRLRLGVVFGKDGIISEPIRVSAFESSNDTVQSILMPVRPSAPPTPTPRFCLSCETSEAVKAEELDEESNQEGSDEAADS